MRQSMEMAPAAFSPLNEWMVTYDEAERDYFTASLRQINHLIQIDEKPNLEMMEPRWELYKISISFQHIGKFNRIIKWGATPRWSFPPNFTRSSRDDNHREDAPHFISTGAYRKCTNLRKTGETTKAGQIVGDE